MIKTLGLDFSLTHSAVVALNERNEPFVLFDYKDVTADRLPYVIKYKEDSLEDLEYKVINIKHKIIDELKKYKLFRDKVILGIDFSAMVHFNSARLQTVYTSYAVSLLKEKLRMNSSVNIVPKIITPRQIRDFAGLRHNEKKSITQDWYLTNTPLCEYDLDSFSEDSIDASMIAYYVEKIKD